MSVGKQIVVAAMLLLALLGTGAFLHFRSDPEAGAEAAVGSEPSAAPVELETVHAGTVRERIEAVGTTIARQAVDVVPLASGRIVEIAFRPGQKVAAGDVLVRLDDEMERASVTEAQAALREAELALERANKLRTSKAVAEATVDQLDAAHIGAKARLERAQHQLAERTIRAPFPGVVGLRRVDIGARVDDQSVLTTLDDLAEVEIDFAVPEIFFDRVRPGQTVDATTSAFPGTTFSGRIATIDSRIGEVSRAFHVRAVIPNADFKLPAGMFMHVDVVLEERPALLVSEESVLAEGKETFVFAVEDGRAHRRAVVLGQREAGSVEVVEGLTAGEVVVKRGLQRVRDDAPVRVIDGAKAPPGAGPEAPSA